MDKGFSMDQTQHFFNQCIVSFWSTLQQDVVMAAS